ncbi:S1 family peptidase [uncultured Brevundimonas sp.]|uniref:S1 family peptidase n=1 Tax=uncultured Brevundimonas sp. TaxID=213418 RepID=UPI0030EF3618|tara:strand:+ start:1750 stop:2934 length:1185 start_codon:yes stop_codon:yes gene_type:complete
MRKFAPALKVSGYLVWFGVLFPVPSMAQIQTPPPDPPAPSGRPAFESAAAAYAHTYGVSESEAARRLSLQNAIADLEQEVKKTFPDRFAGLWIEHQPEFRVVVRLTGTIGTAANLVGLTSPVRNITQFEVAPRTLQLLIDTQEGLYRELLAEGVELDVGLDVKQAVVELYILGETQAEKVRQSRVGLLPDFVQIIAVHQLSTLDVDVRGGQAMVASTGGYCTSGPTVRNAAGVRGVTTNAHCPNTLDYDGVWTSFQAERQGNGAYDVQWHTVPGRTVRNQVNVGTATPLTVTATLAQAAQPLGSSVCKYGWTTGFTCGTIFDKNYGSQGQTGWVRVRNSGYDLSESGDSGAAWMQGDNTVYGIHVGGAESVDPWDAFYMGIDRVQILGLSVLTQ